MLNLDDRYLPAKTCVYIALIVYIFICNIPNVLADSVHYKDSVSSKTDSVHQLPTNLNEISLTKLKSLKKELESKSEQLWPTQNALDISEKKLLNSLIAYDNVRLQIAEVIIKLVDEYNVTGSYKKKLLGYCDTFSTRIKPARNNVHSLNGYKVYGTHFAVAYISLLYTFKENPTFQSKYMKDINDPKSTIGNYRRELAISYGEIEKVQKEYESITIAKKLHESILQLDKEINLRKEKLIAHHKVD